MSNLKSRLTRKMRPPASFEVINATINRELLESVSASGILLDAGCGRGKNIRSLEGSSLRFRTIVGIDIHFPDVQSSKNQVSDTVRLLNGNALSLPFANETFDCVLSNQVIEHLNDTDLFMREIRRVLAPGGCAVVSTNNLASWHNVGALVAGWQPMPCHVSDEVTLGNPASFAEGYTGYAYPMHRRIFTGRALAALARHHGLTVEADAAAGYYPLPPKAARVAARIDRRHGAFLVQRYGLAPA